MNIDTPETDANAGYPDFDSGCWKYNKLGLYVGAYFARNLERERDQLKRWKDEMETVGGWWLAVDEAIRKHPDATIGDTTPNIMLRFIRERDEARATCEELVTDSYAVTLAQTVVKLERERNEARQSIANLNQRLQERQESFQAQLIRIEDVWREKLTESRKDADRLYNCLLEVGVYELDEHYYVSNVLAQHEELVRNG